jgi:hypothetical protein
MVAFGLQIDLPSLASLSCLDLSFALAVGGHSEADSSSREPRTGGVLWDSPFPIQTGISISHILFAQGLAGQPHRCEISYPPKDKTGNLRGPIMQDHPNKCQCPRRRAAKLQGECVK